MALFALHCLDKPNNFELRAATREAHLAYWGASGAIRLGGPYLDDQERPIGSLIIVEAADAAAAEALSQKDPYRMDGVFQSVEVRGWRYTAGQLP
jgi:uncharacterized protein YciI